MNDIVHILRWAGWIPLVPLLRSRTPLDGASLEELLQVQAASVSKKQRDLATAAWATTSGGPWVR